MLYKDTNFHEIIEYEIKTEYSPNLSYHLSNYHRERKVYSQK